MINNNLINLWESLYPKENKEELEKVKLLVTNINHIDAGTPDSYYEAVYKLNRKNIDTNGNIVFPNAKINANSKNIIALPNSDSRNIILNNCIVPEDALVNNDKEVLKVKLKRKEYFNNIKIKDFV